MGISHVFTSPIADGTNTQLVRPSDWNSSHAYTLQDAVSLSGNTAGVLANISSGTLYLAGGNNITLSQNGNSVTLSGANVGGAQTGISGVQVSDNTFTSGTVSFRNANGISFGSSGANGVSASYTVPVLTNSSMTVSDAATSGTLARLAFTNLNGVTLSLSTGAGGSHTIVGSHNGLTSQSTDFHAITLGGNTAGTTTFHATNNRTVFLHGGNNITLSGNGSSITISAFTQSVQTQMTGLTAGMSTNGNTSGDTGLVSNRLVLIGGNNITLSGSTNGQSMSLTISGANAGGAQTGISGISVSDTQFTSGTVTFRNANGISFGSSGAQGISASHNAITSQSTQFLALTLAGNTLGTSTFHATNNASLFFNGGNNITLSGNGSTVTISAAAQTVQTQNLVALIVSGANGNATFTSGTVSVKVGAEITLSTGANVFSIYGNATAAQTNQTLGLYASSNTTGQSSSTTVDARTLSVRGMGIASVGYSAGELIVSVPAGGGAGDGGNTIVAGTRTASSSASVLFSDANGVSFGLNAVNGTVLTASVAAQTNQTGNVYANSNTFGTSSGTYDARTLSIDANGILSAAASNSGWELSAPAIMSRWFNSNLLQAFATQHGNSSVSVVPILVQWPLAVSILRLPVFVTVVTTTNNSSAFLDLSCSAVLYSRNVSTLSSILSGSVSLTHTRTSNATGSVTGPQWIQLTFNQTTLPPGDYWWAVHVSTTNTATAGAATTALGNSMSMMGVAGNTNAYGVRVWAAGTNSSQGLLGQGILSTNATRASIGFTALTVTGAPGLLAALEVDMALATVY